MSENKPDKPKITVIPSRGSVLSDLESVRQDIYHKVKSGRIRDPSVEKARIDQARLFVYICQVEAAIMKDLDLDELKKRVAELERAPGPTRPRQYIPEQNYDPVTLEGGK